MSTQHAIELASLTKQFGHVTALDSVDLEVQKGDVFGLLGPNGAGKSTMIDLVLGLTTPTKGQVLVFGTDVADDPRTVRCRLGVLPDSYDIYNGMSGREHIRAITRLKDADDDPSNLRDAVNLDAEAFERDAGGYSKGMTQRLVLATALIGDPDLLILDEPMSGLDPSGIALVREIIRDRAAAGTTIFFSSHRLAEVEAVCDRVGIVNNGRLIAMEDVETLSDRATASERLRLFTEEQPGDELMSQLQSLDGVGGLHRHEESLVIDCTNPEAKGDVIERLNRTCSIQDFELDTASLEAVFDNRIEHDRTGPSPKDSVVNANGGEST